MAPSVLSYSTLEVPQPLTLRSHTSPTRTNSPVVASPNGQKNCDFDDSELIGSDTDNPAWDREEGEGD